MPEFSLPRILIVEDDYYFGTDVLGYHFKRQGFDVVNAYAASEFEGSWIDVDAIVLDIRLPEKPGELIDPWAGLRTLNKIRGSLGDCSIPLQLENCIIRSAQTLGDAKAASISVPKHFKWFPPDVSFSELLETLQVVLKTNMEGTNP